MNTKKLAEIDQNLEQHTDNTNGISIETVKDFIAFRGSSLLPWEVQENSIDELEMYCNKEGLDTEQFNQFVKSLYDELINVNASMYDTANELEVPSGYPYVIIIPSSGHDGEGTEIYWSKYPGMSVIFNFDMVY